MKNSVVRPSTLHGKGLFACRDFKAGEGIEPIEGEIVLRESHSKYAVPLRGKRSLLLTNKTKHVNWSTDPNVVLDSKKWQVVAIKDIAAGDELTCEYHSIFTP